MLLDSWVLNLACKRANGTSPEIQSRLRKDVIRFAAELAGPSATPIEAALAKTAALAWHSLRMAEAQYLASDDLMMRQAEYLLRVIDHAHRRYVSAMKTLVAVRRLAVPSLMVNIARNQQVNTGGPPR
jgi:hypothetical protein